MAVDQPLFTNIMCYPSVDAVDTKEISSMMNTNTMLEHLFKTKEFGI